MSASSRRVAVALTLTLFGWPLRSQSPSDTLTGSPQQPDTYPRPLRESGIDRHRIDAAMIARERGARSLGDVLTSRVPGLLVVPGPGVNGMGSRIRMRGVQSLVADRAPLVLLDGMRVDAAEDAFSPNIPWGPGFGFEDLPLPPGPLRLDDLNPDDIDHIEVLPGPASTAIYGPGASGGVILIQTKRGRPGPPRFEGYAQGGVSSFRALTEPSPFRTALRRQYGLGVSGGSAWGDYRVAGEFAGDAGPYSASITSPDPNYHRRLNARMSGRVRPWSTVEIALNAARMSSDLRLPPDLPLQVGVWGPSDSTGFDWSRMFRKRSTQAMDRWSTIVEARWNPLPWIGVRGLRGVDAVAQRDTALWPYSAAEPTSWGSLAEGKRHMRHRTLELAASATLALSSVVLSTTVGVQHLRDSLEQEWSLSSDAGGGFGSTHAGAARWQKRNSLGYYVEEQVAFNRKLFLSAAVRHDKFKEIKRSATHPSFALSWVEREVDSARVSLIRLRFAYGSAGPRLFDGMTLLVVPIGTPVPRIDPERTTSAEVGLDAALFGSRVGARLTYYTMRSRVSLVTAGPPFGGFPGSIDYNAGSIRNRGIEATITGKVLTGPGAAWDVMLSLWGNRNRLAKFDGLPLVFGTWGSQGIIQGYPVGGYWAFPIRSVLGPGRVWAGTPYPTQGAMLSSEWRLGGSLRAALTLDYRAGHSLFNQVAFDGCRVGTCRDANNPQVVVPTTDYFEDADYLKLRELSLTWYARPGVAAAIGARSVAVTVAGRNLATWTGYSGVDPEAGSYGIVQPGFLRTIADVATIPVPRSWVLRLDLAY